MSGSSVGELVRQHRFRVGLSQDQLAGSAGMSVRALRYLEQGRVRRPHASSLRRLAGALGLTGTQSDALLAAIASADLPSAGPVAGAGLRIAVLGPLTVRRGGTAVEVSSTMLGTMLGLLAARPGEVVTAAEIVDVLWGVDPPRTCAQLVHTYVGQLRRLVEPDRGPGVPAGILRRGRTGYRLDLTAGQSDVLALTDLAGRARQARAAGDAPRAAELYEAATGLWRGPVLVGAADRLRGHPAVVAIAALRVAVALEHADLALSLGHGDRLVGPLHALVGEEPLHEGLAARLMLALAAGGQQAAALSVFAAMRERLDEELGVGPGPELRAAQRDVLRAGDAAAPGAPAPPPVGSSTVPAQLPVAPAGFVGRADLLRALDAQLPAADGGAARVVAITTVAGMGGVGKTALALRWSHRVSDRFPGGQLYVDLRGHAATAPVRPIDALVGFLLALGVPADRIPDDLDRAAALYRSELATRRVLVLLDNAASAQQVRPLLPGGPGCVALVTSRHQLGGLVAREGARQVTVDVLAPAEAVALLRQMLGGDRVRAEPAEAAELARLCAYLPLALRVAAANLAGQPGYRIGDYVALLATGDRLRALSVEGDPATAVHATFDLSYDGLPEPERRVFRLLGLLPAAVIDADAAAALADVAVPRVRQILDALATRHLVQEPTPGRYGMHDLLRLYAAGLAQRLDTIAERSVATDRVGRHYLHRVVAAAKVLYPHVLALPEGSAGPLAAPTEDAEGFTTGTALSFLDGERPNLVALLPRLTADGHHGVAWRLGDALQGYFRMRMNSVDWQVVAETALAAARADDDQVGEAVARLSLGSLCDFQTRVEAANDHYTAALELARRAGWAECQAVAVNNLARTYWVSGRLHETIEYLLRALALNRRAGRRVGESVTLSNLGVAYLEAGRAAGADGAAARDAEEPAGMLARARACFDEALALHRELGDRQSEAYTLCSLAGAQADSGSHAEALRLAQEGVAMAVEAGNVRVTAVAHNALATVHTRLGRARPALRLHRNALTIARETGDRHLQAQILVDLAGTSLALGRHADAFSQASEARAIAERVGARRLERMALAVLDAVRPAAPSAVGG
jgi:DNA-binding SARP family transcriptional activator/tetratricopeptide (TPR) repeat protein